MVSLTKALLALTQSIETHRYQAYMLNIWSRGFDGAQY